MTTRVLLAQCYVTATMVFAFRLLMWHVDRNGLWVLCVRGCVLRVVPVGRASTCIVGLA